MNETNEENDTNIKSNFPRRKKEIRRMDRAGIHNERPGEHLRFCQNCGKELETGTNFCPVCGKPIHGGGGFQPQMPMPMPMPMPYQAPGQPPHFGYPGQPQPPYGYFRTAKPIVGGILILLGAVWCLVTGILSALSGVNYYLPYRYEFYYLGGRETWLWIIITIAVFQFWGFAIGLTGGILSFKRTKFVIAIIGASFVIVGAGLAFILSVLLGILILIFGILGLIFIAISKNEFIPSNRYPMPNYPPQ